MKSLNIPASYRRTGLYVYCNKCKGYSKKKDGRLKKTPVCNHPPERQVYKIKIHIPATHRSAKTLVLQTRDIQEADKKRIEFINLLKINNYKLPQESVTDTANPNRWLHNDASCDTLRSVIQLGASPNMVNASPTTSTDPIQSLSGCSASVSQLLTRLRYR